MTSSSNCCKCQPFIYLCPASHLYKTIHTITTKRQFLDPPPSVFSSEKVINGEPQYVQILCLNGSKIRKVERQLANLFLDVPRIPWYICVQLELCEGVPRGCNRHYRVYISTANSQERIQKKKKNFISKDPGKNIHHK